MKQSTQEIMPKVGNPRGAGRRRRTRQQRRPNAPTLVPSNQSVIPLIEGVPPATEGGKAPRRAQRSPQRTLFSVGQRRSEPTQRSKSRRPTSPVVYCIRLLISGIGISVIAGSLLAAWDPATRSTSALQTPIQQAATPPRSSNAANLASPAIPATTSALRLTTELATLKTEIQGMAVQNPGLTPGVFFADLDTGAYVDINGSSAFAAASMIKVPVLIAFFQDVDAGKVQLDEIMTMRPEQIASGSGDMQYLNPGTQFSALEVATKMIVISDNTATNMLIERLGGAAALNQRFATWGLSETVIRNRLPDLEGTNTTRPRDLALLMVRVSNGDLVSMRSRDRLLDIMRRTETNTLLPQGLDQDAAIAHKTGDIGSMVGDVGLVDMPNGKRYVAVAMMKRPHNDSRAQELIRQISRSVYKTFSRPPALPRVAPSPTTSPTTSPTASPAPANG